MTNEEYNVFMYAVDENLHRVDRIARANQYQVALVVSMDIYYLMVTHAQNPIYTGDTYGEYHGVPIAVVSPEHGMTEFAEPAIIGMVYDPMMLEGDIIVVGDDNSLYRLESREPLQFTNMGVTVQFGPARVQYEQEAETAQEATTQATVNITAPTMNMRMDDDGAHLVVNAATWDAINMDTIAGIPIGAETAYAPYWTRAPYEPYAYYHGGTFTGTLTGTVNVDALREAIGTAGYEYTYRPEEDRVVMRKRAKKQEELKPGDTKALDEFLDSFIRHGA